ncbi:FCD domain-containing protein [Tessaracoccus terricola]
MNEDYHRRRGGAGRADAGLFGEVLNRLGEDIVSRRLAEGEVLVTEQLCENFGVSRSVMREVMRTLSSLGLVEARQHRGTRVTPMTSWDLLNSRVIRWRGRGANYLEQQRELLELRLGVEAVAASLAAMRAAPELGQAMMANAEAMGRAILSGDRHGFFDADAHFHSLLVQGSGNHVIAQFADTVWAILMIRSSDLRPGMRSMLVASVDRHMDLARAITERDPEAAEARARVIVEETLKEFADDVGA